MVKINQDQNNQLTKPSSADCFQVRSISEERFVKKLGFVPEEIMDEIKTGFSKVLSIHNE